MVSTRQQKKEKARTEGATQATPNQTSLEDVESPTLTPALANFATGPRTVRRGGTTNSTNSTKDTTTANKNTAPPVFPLFPLHTTSPATDTAAATAAKPSPAADYVIPFVSTLATPPVTTCHFEANFVIVGNLIGSGSFGKVYKCQSTLDRRHYAVKEVKHTSSASKEARILAILSDYPASAAFLAFHVVRYYSAWAEGSRLFIQTELCTSTLRSKLDLRQPMPHKRRCELLHAMLLALTFIHKRNICHLDIKPENIFIKGDDYKLGVSIGSRQGSAACPDVHALSPLCVLVSLIQRIHLASLHLRVTYLSLSLNPRTSEMLLRSTLAAVWRGKRGIAGTWRGNFWIP
jgi:hypothetical protein